MKTEVAKYEVGSVSLRKKNRSKKQEMSATKARELTCGAKIGTSMGPWTFHKENMIGVCGFVWLAHDFLRQGLHVQA